MSGTFEEKMEPRLVRSSELRSLDTKLPALPLIHFKFVLIGESTLARHDHTPVAVCDEAEQQQGFYLIAETVDDLQKELHNLVDRFISKVKEHDKE